METIAGHHFASLMPGCYCSREGCCGVSSLIELTALADIAKIGDERIAHLGQLNGVELEEIRRARDALRKRMEALFPKGGAL